VVPSLISWSFAPWSYRFAGCARLVRASSGLANTVAPSARRVSKDGGILSFLAMWALRHLLLDTLSAP
jgi:hypothetical protein